MKAVVAVDRNWGIGCEGKLLERIPEDMRFIKQLTLGKVIVMGRKTFESLPKQEPLKDRINIVISSDQAFNNDKVIICRTISELLELLKKYNSDDVFVFGGETIYKQLLPYCNAIYVTKIDNTYKADTYFINLDEDKSWRLVSNGEILSYNGIKYRHTIYLK